MQSVTGLVRVKPFGKTVIMEQQITAKNLIYYGSPTRCFRETDGKIKLDLTRMHDMPDTYLLV